MNSIPSVEFTIATINPLRPLTCIRPADPNELLNALSDDEYNRDQLLPYWAERWPSCEVMADFLNTQDFSRHTRICELGCGIGVGSTVLAARGNSIVSTDISFDSCCFTQSNIRRNTGHSLCVCCDWRTPPFKKDFDVIIGSDILYEERWIAPIVSFIKNHLSLTGVAYIADPGRRFLPDFVSACQNSALLCRTDFSKQIDKTDTRIKIIGIQHIP